MKKFFVYCALSLCFAFSDWGYAYSQFKDTDGQLALGINWPGHSIELRNFLISYEVNGIQDATIVETVATIDSSIFLQNEGDWAVARIWAISVLDDTSDVFVSDTAYRALSTGSEYPPATGTWIE